MPHPAGRRASPARRRIGEDFARWEVGSVILGPMPNRQVMAGFLTSLLGRPPDRLAGVELWTGVTVSATGPELHA
jgi:hypothetical protein